MEVAIMLEGQDGMNWTRWQRLVRTIEDAGFVGLYRSDHYTNPEPPDLDSLELWVSLTWLACNTSRIVFGPLVSPISFRQPTMTARIATAVDDLSGGRLNLGLGGGWQEREHANYGWDLLPLKDRFDRFEEGVEIIHSLIHGDEPVTLQGKYFRIQDAVLLPRPARPGGPPILIGGNGETRTLRLAARFATMWNGVFVTRERYKELSDRLDGFLADEKRQPQDVHRSLMTAIIFGKDEADVERAFGTRSFITTREEAARRGCIAGTPGQIVDELGRWEEAGCQRVMLQWQDLDDIAGIEALAASVLPQVQAG